MARYGVDDKVRVKPDAQSPPPPSYVRGRSALVVKVHEGSWMATLLDRDEQMPPSVQLYRIKLVDAEPHEQAEHDIGEDWLEPE